MLIQRLSFFFRPLATAANYSLDKELKLAEMDEQSVEVHIRDWQQAVGDRSKALLSTLCWWKNRSVLLAAKFKPVINTKMQNL